MRGNVPVELITPERNTPGNPTGTYRPSEKRKDHAVAQRTQEVLQRPEEADTTWTLTVNSWWAWCSFMSTFIIFSKSCTSLKFIRPSLFLSAFRNQSPIHLERPLQEALHPAHDFLGGPDHQQTLSERYWSSFSRSPMFSWFSISFLMPRIQDWASSADSATRSRLPRRPRKTSVKHRSAGNSSARLRSTSDWCPSRTASTSLTETGERPAEDGGLVRDLIFLMTEPTSMDRRLSSPWRPGQTCRRWDEDVWRETSCDLFPPTGAGRSLPPPDHVVDY
ncbi:hypothetical protein EYF80_053249 [Liparis tanakae]|uniref:Uncharacterized protein n=1 Tax=Liparis tanakae TaxID=230148 RepID=A0A4Z2F8G4_9TELE|nr:hypothetical protein EYF80_053249 [Liparis tanakae]